MNRIKGILGILLVGLILIGCAVVSDLIGAWLF